VAGIPTPLKSMSSMRNPTDGLGAPWYCSSSPTPRNWKNRGRDVPPDQFRFGTSPSTSCRCCRPADWSTSPSSTVVLAGNSLAGAGRSDAVTTISSSGSSGQGPAAWAGNPDMSATRP
jgi:hypothetical protein